ncbi:hypothetical protein FQZ97_793410 [compost metagenome]
MTCPFFYPASGQGDRADLHSRDHRNRLTYGRVAPQPAQPANLMDPFEVVPGGVVMRRQPVTSNGWLQGPVLLCPRVQATRRLHAQRVPPELATRSPGERLPTGSRCPESNRGDSEPGSLALSPASPVRRGIAPRPAPGYSVPGPWPAWSRRRAPPPRSGYARTPNLQPSPPGPPASPWLHPGS